MKEKIKEILSSEMVVTEEVERKLDTFLECLGHEQGPLSLEDVLAWYDGRKAALEATVKEIGLKEVEGGWFFDEQTGNLKHSSGGFFEVIGVEVATSIRESGKGWKQPIVDQGTESSVAGIIRRRRNGIYEYLLEAKFEPGNYGDLQFSPTLQVTYSNLNALHQGRKPTFTEYFDGTVESATVLYDHWLPEDGGRFYNKRVKNMLVEVPEDEELDGPPSFIWLTLRNIKDLLQRDNLVNPHVRSILSTM